MSRVFNTATWVPVEVWSCPETRTITEHMVYLWVFTHRDMAGFCEFPMSRASAEIRARHDRVSAAIKTLVEDGVLHLSKDWSYRRGGVVWFWEGVV